MLDAVESVTGAAGSENAPAATQSKYKMVAIVGSHPATVMSAPYDDPSVLIFACSPHNVEMRTLPRVDQWFELHTPIEDETRCFAYLTAVSRMPFVWMRDRRALKSGLFIGAHEYPEKELKGTSKIEQVEVPTGTYQKVQSPDGKGALAELIERRKVEVPNNDGIFLPHMFTSSIAYMLAKAIVDCEQHGIRQIGLWGIMQQSENEFTYQRPGIQYFLGEAQKRGIKVVANRESCLFDMPTWKW
jgi:hypothetical protein